MDASSTVSSKSDKEYVRMKRSRLLYQDLNLTLFEPESSASNKADVSTSLSVAFDKHMQYLYATGKLCDLTVLNGEQKLSMHRIVLAGHSSKYRQVLTVESSKSPSEVALTNVVPEVLAKVVEYMYTGNIVVTEGNVAAVLEVCHQLDLKRLTVDCRRLLSRFDTSNVVRHINLARKYEMPDLRETLVDFVRRHFAVVGLSPDFALLDVEDLCTVIEGNDVRQSVDEEDILRAAMQWINTDQLARHDLAARVLKGVRLRDVPAAVLDELVEKTSSVADVPDINKLLYDAYRYQALQLHAAV